uniref:Uncharacterized protein n=1 Tax=Lactuca sativa TaxID=4236 RepID=A0A9R1VJP7_LACSA|nr:hypothetical protein LSAT_V11C500282810 [Lactuca sativa]
MCSVQENTVSVHDDNLEVVDLEALIPSSSTGKRPIEITATTNSLDWSSLKDGGVTLIKLLTSSSSYRIQTQLHLIIESLINIESLNSTIML